MHSALFLNRLGLNGVLNEETLFPFINLRYLTLTIFNIGAQLLDTGDAASPTAPSAPGGVRQIYA